MHSEDAGVHHHSPVVDHWRPAYAGTMEVDPIEVKVDGYRHDEGEDYPDQITATNVFPGFLAEVGLDVPDARRLGEALIRAADLAEGKVRA